MAFLLGAGGRWDGGIWDFVCFLNVRKSRQARAAELSCKSLKEFIFLVRLLAPSLATCFYSENQLGATCKRTGTDLGYFKPLLTWVMETTAINFQYSHLTV